MVWEMLVSSSRANSATESRLLGPNEWVEISLCGLMKHLLEAEMVSFVGEFEPTFHVTLIWN